MMEAMLLFVALTETFFERSISESTYAKVYPLSDSIVLKSSFTETFFTSMLTTGVWAWAVSDVAKSIATAANSDINVLNLNCFIFILVISLNIYL